MESKIIQPVGPARVVQAEQDFKRFAQLGYVCERTVRSEENEVYVFKRIGNWTDEGARISMMELQEYTAIEECYWKLKEKGREHDNLYISWYDLGPGPGWFISCSSAPGKVYTEHGDVLFRVL